MMCQLGAGMSRRVTIHSVSEARWLLSLAAVAACGRHGFGGDAAPLDEAVPGSDAETVTEYQDLVLADGPVAYWRLGDASTVLQDASGNGHHGAASGNATLAATGLIAGNPDGALRLDGATGYVAVPDHARLRFTSAITIEAWVWADAFDHVAGGEFPRIVQKGVAVPTEPNYALLVAQVGTSNTAVARFELQGVAIVSGGTVLLPNTVYYLVATYDGTMVRLYVDGKLDAAIAAVGTLVVSIDEVNIGRRQDGNRYWAGTLDEIALYAKALTEAQIVAHHAAGR
jgi:large repetitive protein